MLKQILKLWRNNAETYFAKQAVIVAKKRLLHLGINVEDLMKESINNDIKSIKRKKYKKNNLVNMDLFYPSTFLDLVRLSSKNLLSIKV